jgi:hypothetical protein
LTWQKQGVRGVSARLAATDTTLMRTQSAATRQLDHIDAVLWRKRHK